MRKCTPESHIQILRTLGQYLQLPHYIEIFKVKKRGQLHSVHLFLRLIYSMFHVLRNERVPSKFLLIFFLQDTDTIVRFSIQPGNSP